MGRVLILGGSGRTASAADALTRVGIEVQVYWSRAASTDHLSCAAHLRQGLCWANGMVDTTHVFDAELRTVAHTIAPDLPTVRYARPLWKAEPRYNWKLARSLGEAVGLLPKGARVFAATGRESAEILGHHDGPVFLRQLQRHDDPAPGQLQYVFGAGPFAEKEEAALFQELEIDVLLARNVGGAASYPKIAAARHLGLPVVMVQPDLSDATDTANDETALLAWAQAFVCG
ncbi:MAG: precorrin-6A/cobalt-precorrin-6A reductase [Pseudomonadota bacterium]